jgi:hypothetical protein
MTLLSPIPFPPLRWWQGAFAGGPVYLDKETPLSKMGLRNRYRIAAANGPLWLTVPIAGGREQRSPVGEMRIDNRLPWQRTHWRSITSVYRRTAFFEHYEDSLQILFKTPFEKLVDFNLATISWGTKAFGKPLVLVESVPAEVPFTDFRERMVDYKTGLELPYVQPFMERTGFLTGMSILDGLFCEGPALGGRL